MPHEAAASEPAQFCTEQRQTICVQLDTRGGPTRVIAPPQMVNSDWGVPVIGRSASTSAG